MNNRGEYLSKNNTMIDTSKLYPTVFGKIPSGGFTTKAGLDFDVSVLLSKGSSVGLGGTGVKPSTGGVTGTSGSTTGVVVTAGVAGTTGGVSTAGVAGTTAEPGGFSTTFTVEWAPLLCPLSSIDSALWSSFAVDASNASSSSSSSSAVAATLAWPVWKRKRLLVNYKWYISKYHVKMVGRHLA